MKLLGIMLGAVIGASARYFVGGAIASRMKGPFPLGTLAINLTGCLIIGALWGFAERFGWSPTLRAFLFIG
ncbi:CrcB family protein, partial [bacterium]